MLSWKSTKIWQKHNSWWLVGENIAIYVSSLWHTAEISQFRHRSRRDSDSQQNTCEVTDRAVKVDQAVSCRVRTNGNNKATELSKTFRDTEETACMIYSRWIIIQCNSVSSAHLEIQTFASQFNTSQCAQSVVLTWFIQLQVSIWKAPLNWDE